MKTAAISELPKVWADILRWVTAGEEVQLTGSDKTVARVLPPACCRLRLPRQTSWLVPRRSGVSSPKGHRLARS
jgi:antitoxin (DNA-binding transcriptional repressor) of toxin-antitoxin stability system